MQSTTAKQDAFKLALQFIHDCQQGATPALVRHARKITSEQPRTEMQARMGADAHKRVCEAHAEAMAAQ